MNSADDAALHVADDLDGWTTFVIPPSMTAVKWLFCAYGMVSIAVSMVDFMGWFWASPWVGACTWAAIWSVRLGWTEWKTCRHNDGPALERIYLSSD